MSETGGAILYVLFLWWFGTGVVLYLDRLPRRTFPTTLVAATGLLVVALAGLVATRDLATPAGAVAAFTAAILVWAWNEVAFLTGYVTGPRRAPSPPGATGFARFRAAVAAVLHHELALLVSGLAVLAAVAGGANPVGPLTFGLLWIMRLSTKLNIFAGVPYNTTGLLPPHLAYLESYFRRSPPTALFPISIAATAAATAAVLALALDGAPSAFATTALVLLATLAALGVFEHLLLAAPWRAAELWRWALGRPDAGPPVMERCDIRLAHACDAAGLSRVLAAIARGDFGDVARLRGVARGPGGFVEFDVEGGRPRMQAVAPTPPPETGAYALGRGLDGSRLQDAFDRCATRAAA